MARAQTHAVAAQRRVERGAQRAAQRVEQRAVEQRRAVARQQRVVAALRAGGLVRVVVAREVAERAVGARVGEVRRARQLQHVAQLREVVVVAQAQVLVEPLGCHQLGGAAPRRAAVGQLDARVRERLRALGQRDDAEAKRQPQRHRPLVQRELAHMEARRVAHRAAPIASTRPFK
jgi:hypothetical protein